MRVQKLQNVEENNRFFSRVLEKPGLDQEAMLEVALR